MSNTKILVFSSCGCVILMFRPTRLQWRRSCLVIVKVPLHLVLRMVHWSFTTLLLQWDAALSTRLPTRFSPHIELSHLSSLGHSGLEATVGHISAIVNLLPAEW